MNKVYDEFTDLKVSQATRHQLRRIRDGRCIRCGESGNIRAGFKNCVTCQAKAREYNNSRRGHTGERRIQRERFLIAEIMLPGW